MEDVNGNWVTEQDQLKLIATDYFKELYSSDDKEQAEARKPERASARSIFSLGHTHLIFPSTT